MRGKSIAANGTGPRKSPHAEYCRTQQNQRQQSHMACKYSTAADVRRILTPGLLDDVLRLGTERRYGKEIRMM